MVAGLLTFSSVPAAHARVARTAAATKLPAYGSLWITSPPDDTILQFAPPNTDVDQTAIATISGSNTELNNPRGLAIDHRGRLWVANLSTNAILVFAANPGVNPKPVLTLAGAKTTINAPIAVALSQSGNVWVANQGSSTITEFAAGAHGNVAPIRTIAGSNAELSDLSGITVTPDGTKVWISEERGLNHNPSLEEFAGTSHGNVKPLDQITGLTTRMDDPFGVVVGINGNDPITVNSDLDRRQAVLKFAPGAHGDAAPKQEIKGENTGLSLPQLPALDAVGNLWVPNNLDSEVVRFGPTQHGNVGPGRLFLAAGLNEPSSIAVFIVPPSVPRAVHARTTKKKLHLTWSTPGVKGGGILGYEVRAHKKGGPWKVVKTTTKPSYTKAHAHKGFSYDVIAFNEAGYSKPTKASKPKV